MLKLEAPENIGKFRALMRNSSQDGLGIILVSKLRPHWDEIHYLDKAKEEPQRAKLIYAKKVFPYIWKVGLCTNLSVAKLSKARNVKVA